MAATEPVAQVPEFRPASQRNRQIVEGALLADVAVVLLLGRIYLPIPVVRTVWRLLAAAPFVLLAERRGIRVTIMSGLVAYTLLTALVGPTLALTALDTAFAAVLLALGERWRWPRAVTVAVMGVVYAVFDIILPTILFALLFRLPASTLVDDARASSRHAVGIATTALNDGNRVLKGIFGRDAGLIPAHQLSHLGYAVVTFVFGHWVEAAILAAVATGLANMAGYKAGSDLVLARMPSLVRARQKAGQGAIPDVPA